MNETILKIAQVLTYTDLVAKVLYKTIGILLKKILPGFTVDIVYGALLVIDKGFDFLYDQLKKKDEKDKRKKPVIDYSKVKLAEFKDKTDPFGRRKEGAERRKRTVKNLIKRTWHDVKNGKDK